MPLKKFHLFSLSHGMWPLEQAATSALPRALLQDSWSESRFYFSCWCSNSPTHLPAHWPDTPDTLLHSEWRKRHFHRGGKLKEGASEGYEVEIGEMPKTLHLRCVGKARVLQTSPQHCHGGCCEHHCLEPGLRRTTSHLCLLTISTGGKTTLNKSLGLARWFSGWRICHWAWQPETNMAQGENQVSPDLRIHARAHTHECTPTKGT